MKEVLNKFNNAASGKHLGETKTLERLGLYVSKAVADWTADYTLCIADEVPVRSRGQLQQYNSRVPFELRAIDLAGLF